MQFCRYSGPGFRTTASAHKHTHFKYVKFSEGRFLISLFSLPSYRIFDIPEIENSERFYASLPCGVRLIFALYNLMESQSEMFCYFVIILNHMVSASLLTLFLPILIFLWAMLSVPRPTKRFWMTAIIYTQVSILPTAAADVK